MRVSLSVAAMALAGAGCTFAVAALAGAGCTFFSGFGSGGYSLEAGAPGCTGTRDCDAGEVCCVASLTLGTACSPAPCRAVSPLPSPVQLCQDDGECGDAGCIAQMCTTGGASLTVQACGAVAGCVAMPAGDSGAGAGADAGAD